MNTLLNQMKVDLELRGYSPKTVKAYVRYVKEFATYFNQSLLDLNTQNIKAFLHYLASKKEVSSSYINGAYSALKFFYQKTMRQNWDTIDLPRSKKLKTLPVILSMSEVQNILDTILNIKHKAIFMTIYGAGLRLSEIVNLTVEDIDSNNMQIRVQQGKGKKDRYTLLSQTNLDLLRDYWKIYKPVKWLFQGRNPNNPFSTRSVQRIFKETCEKAGIKKKATVHTLRHCFATHLLEAGISVYHIQQLLGHSSPKTTSAYIHLTRRDILNVKSPLDLMKEISND